ncbi:D-glycerate dehydrogenase [Paenibacillus antri]|uniref:Glyoxylate/hydroxypyruvate reductase B n=1 Tax=Paenibacillus antri TaxID=2582848 RepID=A0A5R9GBX5_9BACL|nr:D-glycerate dehydrogenase [Paenibacillus antri]TLS52589.1 D-glycerate dehydrogenase [Paenibacillus antri]
MDHGKPKVFAAKRIPPEALAYLEQYCDVRSWDGDGPIPRERLLAALADAEGLLTSGDAIDDELLARAPKLRAVSTVSVGYNHFDLDAMRRRGVVGTHTPYVLDDTVADLVLALMLSAARRVTELDAYVKSGRWERGQPEAALFGTDVHHASLGIVGLGRIGERIAQRAVHGFGMKLYYHNRSRNPEAEERYGAQYVSMDELLGESDFVVLMTPLTPKTERFFRKEHFDRMKPSAFFINASRGRTVDENALVEALATGRIRGAGLDVYEVEPVDPSHPLLAMPNVVTLPHIGSATAQTRRDMALTAARNLVASLRGDEGAYVVKELRS